MDNESKINEIERQIKTLEKEKKIIQEGCSHTKTHVKFQEGTNNMRLYCCECKQQIGFPSQHEIDLFLNVKKE